MSENEQIHGGDVHSRIMQFCEWFDVTPPTLKWDAEEPGQILVTDVFIEWVRSEGVSLDWLVCGDLRSIAAVFRTATQLIAKTEAA